MPYTSWFDTPLPRQYYTDEHESWRSTIRRFVDEEIAPHADDWDEAGTFPLELYAKAARIGLLGMGYPQEYGGLPLPDPFYSLITHQELARHSLNGLNASLGSHNIALPPILATGSDALKERVVPVVLAGEKIAALAVTEPSGGSDVASLQTRAVRDGDCYVVNGSKMFITSGIRAHYFTVAVRTGGEGRDGISLLLIEGDTDGFTRTPLKKMGWWSSDTAALYFDDCRVPAENLIGEENRGFRAVMLNFNSERLMMAAQSIGASRVCLDYAVNWAQERKTFSKRLVDHQVIRHKIATMAQRINASDAWLHQCAWRVMQGETPVVDLSLLKVQATETMEFCAREAMQILGGSGYMRGNPVERIYREVRVSAIGGGSEEILRDLAARQLGL